MPMTIDRPTVSVIVTNYNYADYVLDCLTSIAQQSTLPVECIVVDDCSSDDSVEKIDAFISEHAGEVRFESVHLSSNQGQMNAFIEGFRRSTGDLIVFVDADDLLFPNFLETHLDAHLNRLYPVAVTTSNEILIDQVGRVQSSTIERTHHHGIATRPLSPDQPLPTVEVHRWREDSLGRQAEIASDDRPLLYIAPGGNELREWIWSTTSGCMFRRGALNHILSDDLRNIRICADQYLIHYAHLLGGTAIIQSAHGAYRRHGHNAFASNPVIGSGTLAGRFPDDAPRSQFMKRLETDLLRRSSQLVELMGAPRAAQALAAYLPTGRAVSALRQIPNELRLPFVALLLPKAIKRRWLAWRRFRQFI